MPDTTPTLRDRIRRAICEASGFTWLPDELMEPDEYGEHADAVLAVLPEPPARLVSGSSPGPDDIQVWPLRRVLAEVRCGSQDWSWDEEWADLDQRHAESGYLDRLEQQIKANGITLPVLIGSDGRLWDGHHRLRIAVRLGIDYVPVEVTAPARLVLGTTDQQPTTAPVDRAAEVEQLRTENARMRHELEVMYGGAFDKPRPTPLAVLAECDAIEADYRGQRGDVAVGALAAVMRIRARAALPEFELRGDTEIRAAALSEAADYAQQVAKAMATADEDWASRAGWACASVATGLRRMADEAQQPETEAVVPAQHAPGKVICCPDCRAKGYTVCRDEPAADQPDTETEAAKWAGATELAPDREIRALAATGLVGYRQGNGRLLHCLAHKPAPASRWADFHEVTADDLDDGGMCVHPRCGRDLLAAWPAP